MPIEFRTRARSHSHSHSHRQKHNRPTASLIRADLCLRLLACEKLNTGALGEALAGGSTEYSIYIHMDYGGAGMDVWSHWSSAVLISCMESPERPEVMDDGWCPSRIALLVGMGFCCSNGFRRLHLLCLFSTIEKQLALEYRGCQDYLPDW